MTQNQGKESANETPAIRDKGGETNGATTGGGAVRSKKGAPSGTDEAQWQLHIRFQGETQPYSLPGWHVGEENKLLAREAAQTRTVEHKGGGGEQTDVKKKKGGEEEEQGGASSELNWQGIWGEKNDNEAGGWWMEGAGQDRSQ